MVSLDRKQRSAVFSFWRQVFICLIVFAVSYLSVIRPTQEWIINRIIFPIISDVFNNYQNIQIQPGFVDEILVNSQARQNSIQTSLELPFNGHILLALTLLIASGNNRYIRFLIYYQLALMVILPTLGWAFINGNYWISIIIFFHEKAHKAAFLMMGLLSIKSKADSVSAGKILNK